MNSVALEKKKKSFVFLNFNFKSGCRLDKGWRGRKQKLAGLSRHFLPWNVAILSSQFFVLEKNNRMYHSRCYIGHGSGTHIREIYEKLFGYGRRQPCLDKQAQPLSSQQGLFYLSIWSAELCVFRKFPHFLSLSLSAPEGIWSHSVIFPILPLKMYRHRNKESRPIMSGKWRRDRVELAHPTPIHTAGRTVKV